MAKLHAAALLVMRGIALGLGKPEDFFSAHMDLRHDDNASQARGRGGAACV